MFVVVVAQLSKKYLWALFQLIYTGMRGGGGTHSAEIDPASGYVEGWVKFTLDLVFNL